MNNVIRFKAPKTCQVDPRGALIQYCDYQKLELELAALKPSWQPPETIPQVPVGTEQEFWIAVHSQHTNKTHVYLAQYQNRPLNLDEHGEQVGDDDYYLVDVDGEYVDSVGWVMNRQHVDFDNYYEKINFTSDYQLLGWANYQPPTFDGLTVEGGAAC